MTDRIELGLKDAGAGCACCAVPSNTEASAPAAAIAPLSSVTIFTVMVSSPVACLKLSPPNAPTGCAAGLSKSRHVAFEFERVFIITRLALFTL